MCVSPQVHFSEVCTWVRKLCLSYLARRMQSQRTPLSVSICMRLHYSGCLFTSIHSDDWTLAILTEPVCSGLYPRAFLSLTKIIRTNFGLTRLSCAQNLWVSPIKCFYTLCTHCCKWFQYIIDNTLSLILDLLLIGVRVTEAKVYAKIPRPPPF